MDNVYKLINEIKSIVISYRTFISEHVIPLENIEPLNKYIDFSKINEILIEFDEKIENITDLDFTSEYNYNFINYIEEEKNNFEYQFNNYNNENFKQNLSKINNNEIVYNNIKLQKENIAYGGGRSPLNKDELLIYDLMYLENNMYYVLDSINNFFNNLHILKDFSELDTNVVIIGANGSGKSTLSRRLKTDSLSQSINIISSHHILHLTSDDFIIPRNVNEVLDIDTYQQEKKLVTEEEPFDNDSFIKSLHNLINYLLNLHHKQKGDTFYQNNEDTILEKIIKICNKLLKKKMVITNGIIACSDEYSNIYDFNQMSDGERQVFYFVASVLVNEKDGYIIVDEPENHLNSQICKLLWDTLENIKKDSTFVYITHDPKFAASRTKAKIVWSKSFKYPNEWEYKVLENNEIPEELLIEVLGSKENIIFCEGKSDSLDQQLYEAIFTEEKIIGVEGHLNVVNYTKAINNMSSLNLNAMGIIDNDGKSDKEIRKYEKNNIIALPFNEVEMLLLSEEVLVETKKCFETYSEEIDIKKWKNEIFQICSQKEEKILMNILKARVDNKLTMQRIQTFNEINDIKNELTTLIKSINVEEIYQNEKENFQRILSEKNYSKLLEICSLKDEVIKQVPHKYKFHNYANRAIGVIKSSNELKEMLKKKYFKKI
ncbi:AAA family ATPase [Mammaliicoccus sciuri]|uniref:AAA family ATPase n=1 Tax=Mammaliicoccus sciuri TaxID=1296 RepID=UPI001AAFAC6D|nr:AAA family ATPase [Mammaliicoccus sciuri]MBO3078974.1 AAA family ATPase [Mammaliicoccus sciuri]MCO4324337.1 ATP-binding protein [Mammaliicoccus sciuri]MEB8373661.1 ATP-binding protein [Mammaliicoccus sciuri]